MQIVIDIPEHIYEEVNAIQIMASGRGNGKKFFQMLIGSLITSVQNGTPLPKGHGRLIDADKYRKDMQESREFNFFATLDWQPTIIEADKESEEK